MNALGPGGTLKPPTPKPSNELMTPWWSNLITAIVVATVSILGTAYATGGLKAPSGAPTGFGAAGIVIDTVTYIPHILLLFGVLADMFTYQGVWSIPSLVGLLSIFINYMMQYFWKGLQELWSSGKKVAELGTSAAAASVVGPKIPSQPRSGEGKVNLNPGAGILPGSPFDGGKRAGAIATPAFFTDYDGCNVQGFSGWATPYAPQTLVVTATVFCYYIFDIVRNRGWLNAAASITMFGAFYAMQVGILSMKGGCDGDFSDFQKALMALFEGIVIGGSAYGIVQTYYPERLPSAVVSPFPTKSKKDLTMGPDGKMYDADGYPYVVLPNGQAVPDLSTQNARDAFAALAGQNLGTGTPAKPDSCSNK